MSLITQRFQNIYQLNNHYFEIIGVGSIGSYTTICLAQGGATKFSLWDDDVVDAVNIGVQHYNLKDIGISKVKSMRNQILNINPHSRIYSLRKRFDLTGRTHSAPLQWFGKSKLYHWNIARPNAFEFDKKNFIICGIDNMEGRLQIMTDLFTKSQGYGTRDTWIIDARMGSETFQMYTWRLYTDEEIANILTIQNRLMERNGDQELAKEIQEIYYNAGKRFLENYTRTWYSDEEGSSEPCNARSTNYCGSMAGAFINNAVRKIADSNSLPNKNLVFNFPSMMLQSEVDYSRMI